MTRGFGNGVGRMMQVPLMKGDGGGWERKSRGYNAGDRFIGRETNFH